MGYLQTKPKMKTFAICLLATSALGAKFFSYGIGEGVFGDDVENNGVNFTDVNFPGVDFINDVGDFPPPPLPYPPRFPTGLDIDIIDLRDTEIDLDGYDIATNDTLEFIVHDPTPYTNELIYFSYK